MKYEKRRYEDEIDYLTRYAAEDWVKLMIVVDRASEQPSGGPRDPIPRAGTMSVPFPTSSYEDRLDLLLRLATVDWLELSMVLDGANAVVGADAADSQIVATAMILAADLTRAGCRLGIWRRRGSCPGRGPTRTGWTGYRASSTGRWSEGACRSDRESAGSVPFASPARRDDERGARSPAKRRRDQSRRRWRRGST